MPKIGIDLGTTQTVACYAENEITFVKFQGNDYLPSCLLYHNGVVSIGTKAQKKGVVYPKKLISSSKTEMGNSSKVWTIDDREFTPVDVAAEILKTVRKESGKLFNGELPESAVITIPAYFGHLQRLDTHRAAEAAGFSDIKIIPEPVAVAIAYGFDNKYTGRLFVIDLGGGTFDMCAYEVGSFEETHERVGGFNAIHPAGGDKLLGGDDFTNVLRDLCFSEMRTKYGIDLSDQECSGLDGEILHRARASLWAHCEEAKRDLSMYHSTSIDIPNIIIHADGKSVNFNFKISRDEFIIASETLLNRIRRVIRDYIDEAGLEPDNIDRVILAGGSANIPIVRDLVKEHFRKEPYADHDLEKLVAKGAAIYALHKGTGIVNIKDTISHSLGIRTVERGKDVYSVILARGSVYPTKLPEIQSYTTTSDNQKAVLVEVFEGDEHELARNEYYGSFELSNIQEAKEGIPNIEVSFALDDNMILNVTAEDKFTGAAAKKEIYISDVSRGKWEKAESQKVSVYFVFDVTSSMDRFIKGVKETCCKFANTIAERFDELEIGLIIFGDETYALDEVPEMPVIYGLRSDVEDFKDDLANCKRYYGGDIPETSFEAMKTCIDNFDVGNRKKIIVLITDAPAHSPNITGKGKYDYIDVLDDLVDNNITTFTVCPDYDYYRQFAFETGGCFYKIDEYKRFVDTINQIAVEISSLALK